MTTAPTRRPAPTSDRLADLEDKQADIQAHLAGLSSSFSAITLETIAEKAAEKAAEQATAVFAPRYASLMSEHLALQAENDVLKAELADVKAILSILQSSLAQQRDETAASQNTLRLHTHTLALIGDALTATRKAVADIEARLLPVKPDWFNWVSKLIQKGRDAEKAAGRAAQAQQGASKSPMTPSLMA